MGFLRCSQYVIKWQLMFEWLPALSSEKAMAPHSSTLAWKIPWTEEPGRLQSMGSLRVWHYWATSLSLSCLGEGNGNPLQCSCLENPRDGGAWWAPVFGVEQSRTRLSSIVLKSFVRFSLDNSYLKCYYYYYLQLQRWENWDLRKLHSWWRLQGPCPKTVALNSWL